MQTPAGYQMIDGRFFPKVGWKSSSVHPFVYRLAHTVSAFYVTTAFVVLGVARLHCAARSFVAEGRMMLRLALWFLAIFVPVQMVLGDMHGLNTLDYQPAKLAAMEGLWEPGAACRHRSSDGPISGGAQRREIAIPRLGSLYLTHSWNGEVKGLKDFPPDQRPPVRHGLFRLPDHGRHRCCDVHGRMRTAAVVAAAPRHDGLVFETLPARVSVRLHRGHRRMDDDGSRPAALDDLRLVADGGFGLPVPHRRRCAAVAPALCRCLSRHLSGWAVLMLELGGTGPQTEEHADRRRPAESAYRSIARNRRIDMMTPLSASSPSGR